MNPKKSMNRREFVGKTSAAAAFTIIPKHVLGGKKYVAPSDKINLAYIGCGTQGLREMTGLIQNPHVFISSVCDPNKFSTNYVDWSPHGLRNAIRKVMDKPAWGSNFDGIPGGRDVAKELIDTYYGNHQFAARNNCTTYIDFREQLEKEKNIDAVKIMTPDHLHAAIAIAAMKAGKHVVMHKPIANRMLEADMSIKIYAETGVNSHLLAWSERSGYDVVHQWLNKGAIGNLMEIHNWSNRPVWPQWTSIPEESVPVPEGFNWDLWLGPVPHRAYHPNFTHAVFRGWYDFGGGSIADMGHYSLWPLFHKFDINKPPRSAEAYGTTTSVIDNHVSHRENNNVAFPHSCIVRFDFQAQDDLPAFKLFWYDGGMKPPTPDEIYSDDKTLPAQGMMFIGDKGKILAGFHCENPRIIPEQKMIDFTGSAEAPEDKVNRTEDTWIHAFKDGRQSPGNFLKARTITETILLGTVALRAGGILKYDNEKLKISNNETANTYFTREYRKGWELST